MEISNNTIKNTAYSAVAGAALGAGAAYGVQKGAKMYQAAKAAKEAKAAEEAAKRPIRTNLKKFASAAWDRIKKLKSTIVDKTKESLAAMGKAEKISKKGIAKTAAIGALALPVLYGIKKLVSNKAEK